MSRYFSSDEKICHQLVETGFPKYGFNCKFSHSKFSHAPPQFNVNSNVYGNNKYQFTDIEHSSRFVDKMRSLVNTFKTCKSPKQQDHYHGLPSLPTSAASVCKSPIIDFFNYHSVPPVLSKWCLKWRPNEDSKGLFTWTQNNYLTWGKSMTPGLTLLWSRVSGRGTLNKSDGGTLRFLPRVIQQLKVLLRANTKSRYPILIVLEQTNKKL